MSSTDTNDQLNTSPIPQTPGAGYLTAVDAARRFNLTNDHIALLCRKGKVEGLLVGRVRYVSEESLKHYMVRAEEEKLARRKSLSEQMRRGHEAFVSVPIVVAQTPILEVVESVPALTLQAPVVAIAPEPAPLPPVVVVLPEPAPLPPVIVVMPAPAPLPPAFVTPEIIEELFDTPVVSPIAVPTRSPFFDITLRPVFATVLALSITAGAAQYALATPAFGVAKQIFVASVNDMGDEQAAGYEWWGSMVKRGASQVAMVWSVREQVAIAPQAPLQLYQAPTIATPDFSSIKKNGDLVSAAIVAPAVNKVMPTSTLASAPPPKVRITLAVPDWVQYMPHELAATSYHVWDATLGSFARGYLMTMDRFATVEALGYRTLGNSVTRQYHRVATLHISVPQVPNVAIKFTTPAWVAYMPNELVHTSYVAWDNTLGAFARSYLAAANKVADAQALGYQAFGQLVAGTASQVYRSAKPTTLNTVAVAQSSAANVWDAWTTWLAAAYPQGASVATSKPTATSKVAVVVPTYTFPTAANVTSRTAPAVIATRPVPAATLTVASSTAYVTSAQLADRLSQLNNALRSLIYSQSTAQGSSQFVPPQIAANGNGVLYGAAPAPVNTINTATVHIALSASDIPALNYFPATSTIAIGYGGTGTSTSPSYGKLLLGNAQGGYDLVGTSSLGITTTSSSASSTLLSDFNTWSAATTTFVGNISISGNIVPTANNTYSLGSASSTWKDLFVGPGSIYVNGQEVLHTDPAHDVNVTADVNQNLIIQTSGTGDVQLNPTGTGVIYLKGNVLFSGGKTFNTSDNSATTFTDGIVGGNIKAAGNSISANNTNGSVEIDSLGLGAVYVNHGNFGIATTAPMTTLDVYGNAIISGSNRYLNFGGTTGSSGYGLRDNNGTIEFKNSSGSWTGIGTGGGGNSFSYLFPNNATTTGLGIFASTTVGDGTQTGGLTINGGATTTGIANFTSNVILNGSSSLFNSSLTVYQNGSNRAFAVRSNFTQTDSIDQPILFSLASNDTNNPFELDVNQIGASSLANRSFLFQTSQSGVSIGGNILLQRDGGNVGIGTSSPGTLLAIGNTNGINFTTSTSTFSTAGGINITNGCFALNGTCLTSGGGSSASSTLLSDSNIWSGSNLFLSSTTIGNGTQAGGLTISGGATTTGIAYFASRIGIGTVSPNVSFVLDAVGSLNVSGGYAIGQLSVLNKTGTSDTYVRAGSGKGIAFIPNQGNTADLSTAAAYIASSGTVGIGTSTPFGKFAINLNSTDAAYGGNNAFVIASSTSNSTTTLFTITNTGNVGIGSSTPSAFLSVDANAAGLGTGVTPVIIKTQSGLTADMFDILNNTGTLKVRVNSFGNLIGYTGINSAGGVVGGGVGSGMFVASASTASANGYVFQGVSGETGDPLRILDVNNNFLDVINANGNLGVGTSTPFATLGIHAINGSTNTTLFAIGSSTASATTTLFSVSNTGTVNVSSNISAVTSTQLIFGVNARILTQGVGNIDLTATGSGTGFNLLQFGGQTSSFPALQRSGTGLNLLLADGSLGGRLGIGTTSPDGKLSVHANAGETYTSNIVFDIASSTNSSTTTLLSVDNQGQLTAGNLNVTSTLVPSNGVYLSAANTLAFSASGIRRLQLSSGNLTSDVSVVANVNNSFELLASSASASTPTLIPNKADTTTGIGASATGALSLLTAGTDRIEITNSGNVGVASTSPFATFSINANNGSTNTTLFAIGSSTASATTTLFTVTNTGNVGINTSNPTYTLQVGGQAYVSGNITIGSGNLLAQASSDLNLYANNGANLGLTVKSGTGNVGIGTTSPYLKLSVGGDIIGTNITATGTLSVSGLTNLAGGITSYASSTIGNGTQAGGLTISGGATTTGNAYFNGNVGIGTNAPSSILQVSSASPVVKITATSAANAGLSIAAGGVSGAYLQLGNVYEYQTAGVTTKLLFGSSAPTTVIPTNIPFAIDTSSGVVGVGTSTPFAKFAIHANNGETNTTLFAIGSSTASATTTLFSVANTGAANLAGALILGAASTATNGAINLANASGSTFGTLGNISGNSNFYIQAPNGTLALAAGAGSNAVVVNGANNVAIGGTTQANRLDVYGAIAAGAYAGVTAPTNGFITSGNVGFGTTSPFGKFAINLNSTDAAYGGNNAFVIASSTASATTTLFSVGNNSNVSFGIGSDGVSSAFSFQSAGASSQRFLTKDFLFIGQSSGVNNILLKSTNGTDINYGLNIGTAYFNSNTAPTNGLAVQGSVGVGTTSPFGKFAINLNSTDAAYSGNNAFVIASSTSNSTTTLFTVTNTGNVGIGTTNPNEKLTVSGGNIFTSGTLYVAGGTYSFSGSGVLTANTGRFAGTVGIGTSTPYAQLTVWGGTTGNAFEIASNAGNASTTILQVSNAGVVSIGASTLGVPSGIFTVDASSSTTTISNLSVGNLTFDTDAGMVQLSDIPVSSNPGAGTIESQSLSIGGTPTLTVYGENDGSGGVQNLRVSVGTTTPYSRLSVWGAGTGTGQLFELTNNASTTVARFLDNGTGYFSNQITIATTSSNPFSYLTVRGNLTAQAVNQGAVQIGVNNQGGQSNAGLEMGIANVQGSNRAYVQGFSFTTGVATDLALNPFGGNTIINPGANSVGVGTTSPFAKLSVHANNGDTNTTLFAIGSSTASATTTLFTVDNKGNVNANGLVTSFNQGFQGWNLIANNELFIGGGLDTGISRISAGVFGFGNGAAGNTSGSIIALASSTIGDSTQTGGLTISGGATTTGNAYFAGNVGIKTAPSAYVLDISGNTHITGRIDISGYYDGSGFYLNSAATEGVSGNASSHYLTLSTNGNEAARITSSGSFGVGTTSPFAKFSVHANNGDTNTTLFAIGSSTSNSTTTLFAINNIGQMLAGDGSSSFPTYAFAGNSNSGVYNNAGTLSFSSNGSLKLQVGVNTTLNGGAFFGSNSNSPQIQNLSGLSSSVPNLIPNKGDLTTGFAAGASGNINAIVGGTEITRWTSTGFGVGTTSPYVNFAVNGVGIFSGSNPTPLIIERTSNTNSNIQFKNTVNSYYTGINPSGNFGIGNGNDLTNPQLTILNANGNVGVATSTPWGLLSINPNGITGPAFVVGSSTQTAFVITSTGNVGVGTTSPLANFDISVTGGVSKGFVVRDTASGNSWFDVGVASAGQVRFNQAGGVTLAAGAASIGRFNVGALSASSNILSLQGVSGQTGNLFMVDSNSSGTTNNGSQFTINSLGYTGIGTTSPYALLSVGGGNTYPGVQVLFAVASSTNTATTTYLTLDKTGYLAVGAGTGGTDAYGHSVGNSAIFSVDASSSTTTISNLSVGNLTFDVDAGVVNLSDIPIDSNVATGTIESQTIAIGGSPVFTVYGESNGSGAMQNGRVGIGTTTPYYVLDVASTTGAGAVARFTNATGNCTINPTNSALSCSSDQRLKHNINSLGSTTLEAIMNLNPVTYNWNTEATSSATHTGFIAQAVQLIFPDLVSTGGDGYLTLNYAGFVPYIVSAIQELYHTVQSFADEFTTKKLCVADDTGAKTCITKSQLDALLQQAGQTAAAADSTNASSGGGGSASSGSSTGSGSTSSSTTSSDTNTSTQASSTPSSTTSTDSTSSTTTSTTDTSSTATSTTP